MILLIFPNNIGPVSTHQPTHPIGPMRAWQPSAEVWVLAHTKLVTKDFTAPSDARLVESNQKLQEDWQRRKPVMSQQCPWQRHLATEPRGQSALRNLEEDLKSKIIHPSTQPLVKQILNHLTSRVPDDIDIWYMSALRAAASGAHGAGTFLIGSSSNPLCGREGDEIVPFEPHRHLDVKDCEPSCDALDMFGLRSVEVEGTLLIWFVRVSVLQA